MSTSDRTATASFQRAALRKVVAEPLRCGVEIHVAVDHRDTFTLRRNLGTQLCKGLRHDSSVTLNQSETLYALCTSLEIVASDDPDGANNVLASLSVLIDSKEHAAR